jgi:DNA-binding transcriptional LysR family regulator
MELRHLRDFVAVAEELHFTRAAARLHVAQPSLTRQIKNLEEELGVPLFDRANGVTLTEAGRVFFEKSNSVLDLIKQGVESVQRQTRHGAETLSIGSPADFLYELLPGTLAALRKSHPNVTVALSNLTRTEQLRALQERRIDLGFVRGGESLARTGLEVESVARFTAVLALAANSPLARKRAIDLGAYKPLTLVSLSAKSHPDYDEWIRHVCEEQALTRRIVQKVNDEATLLALVGAGVGMALLPKHIRSRPHTNVVFRNPTPPITIECCIAWRAGNNSRLLRDYIQIVREVSSGLLR